MDYTINSRLKLTIQKSWFYEGARIKSISCKVGIFALLVTSDITLASTETVFTVVGKESSVDTRYIYIKELMSLALSKTTDEYGAYSIGETTQGENPARLIRQIGIDAYQNFFFDASATDDTLANFRTVRFPVYRGAMSYRVAFARQLVPCNQISLPYIKKTLNIQGRGWLDSDILKANHFNVAEVSYYQQMFKMIQLGRVDYFFRGIPEIMKEKELFPELPIDNCFALNYPLPKFFITNNKNQLGAERVEKGLIKAYHDGSFIALWNKFFLADMKSLKVKDRMVFKLENPFIKSLNNDYQKYNFTLAELE